ncbi:hypothetical protein [Sphingobacterium multivorum]|uniref:hypothetical protein n=1 Tax=Sphingobacterium multivorum TaxID=28454 RepID=UPI003DA4142C
MMYNHSAFPPLDPPHSTFLSPHHKTLPRNRIGYHDFFVVCPILWQLQTAFLKELYLPKDSSLFGLYKRYFKVGLFICYSKCSLRSLGQ